MKILVLSAWGLSGSLPRRLGVTPKLAAIINRVGRDLEFRIIRGFWDRSTNPLEVHTEEQIFRRFRFRWHDVFTSHKKKNLIFFKWHLFSYVFESSRRHNETTKSMLEKVWKFTQLVCDFAPSAFLQVVGDWTFELRLQHILLLAVQLNEQHIAVVIVCTCVWRTIRGHLPEIYL